MKRFLGMDGGGTSTRVALVESSGRVRGVGTAGPSNYHNVGLQVATDNLRAATQAAYAQAGLDFDPAAGAFLGLAGVKSGRDIAVMTNAAESLNLASQITVDNDLHNALAGGLAGAPGIALIAGTGCNCLGRNSGGASFMCGGWGWLLDDRGSGFGLGAEGLRAAIRSADGRDKSTRLLPAALAFFGQTEPNELLARLYAGEWKPHMVAQFAPIAARLAAEGDAAARRVLRDGAAALAELVTTTAKQLDFTKSPDVVLLGGCVRSGAPYQPMVEQAVRRACPSARLCEPIHDSVHGAVLNAFRAAGLEHPARLVFPPAVKM